MATESLPDDVDALKHLLLEAQQQLRVRENRISALEGIISYLQEEKRLARAQRFAASSEQLDLQYTLFDEAEQLVEAHEAQHPAPPAPIEVKAHQRRGGRRPLPKDLPRVRVVHDLPEAEKTCGCGHDLEKFDEVSFEQVDIIPAQIYVIEHARYKYVCKHCNSAPKTAPLPPQPIPKSQASAGFLAYVATSKYADGIPLYRQCHIFERIGIQQQRHSLAFKMIKTGQLTQPLINLLQDKALDYPYIQMDETVTQVLKEPGKTAQSDSYMWVMRGGPPDESVNKVLSNDNITGLGCWAHARRKFIEAQKALGKHSVKAKRVEKALRYIATLYGIEKAHKGSDPGQRRTMRQQQSLPVLQEFKAWLDSQNITPRSKLGEAITYTLNQWPRLLVYCEDGRLHIDNNGLENKIRPFAVGRKNWLFSASQGGANASANLYSLIETAKANGLNEYAYLKHIFTELPKAQTVEDYEKLLPWNVDPEVLNQLTCGPSLT
jgi:transposase